MIGHIVAIAPPSQELKRLSSWIISWVQDKDISIDPTVYTCSNTKLARHSLQVPLELGSPPSLIIIDHDINEEDISAFAREVREGIPETWVIELASDNTIIPQENNIFLLKKPFKKTEWEEILTHVFLKASTPQWSKAITD